MGRSFNLDLCLVPAGGECTGANAEQLRSRSRSEGSAEKPQQQLTIFYDGRISVCDVTEIQARAILLRARREMDESLRSRESEPPSPCQQPQIHVPGLFMKRSLQRFLQKRKTRIQETSPYNQ